MKSVAFCTLGCKVNQYETDAMYALFKERGYEVREFNEKADVYVINTCTVTNMADKKSRQMLHRAKRTNPDSLVVAVGCYVQAAAEEIQQDPMIDLVVGNNNKTKIVDLVEDKRTFQVEDIAQESDYETMHITEVSEHTRAYIKIQDGCNQFCSYCIIPYARGRVRSRKPEDVLAEVEALTQKGYKEVVLTGIHISSYGLDFLEDTKEPSKDYQKSGMDNTALIELIEALAALPKLERIRLGSLEPRIITQDFVTRLAALEKICPQFHLSLQSGSAETLKRMNRHYTPQLYFEKCQLLRQVFDRPAITTDVIVGFPGETQAEFQESAAFLQKVSFAQMHIFKYSKRQGTRAAKMPDQVMETEKSKRSASLLALDKKLRRTYLEACRDKVLEILIEETIDMDGQTYWVGHSKEYLKAAFILEGDYNNQVILGRIQRPISEEIVFCEIID